jgi:hypothetical protein
VGGLFLQSVRFLISHLKRSGWLLAKRDIPSATALGPARSYAARSFSISILSGSESDDVSMLLIGSVTTASPRSNPPDIADMERGGTSVRIRALAEQLKSPARGNERGFRL